MQHHKTTQFLLITSTVLLVCGAYERSGNTAESGGKVTITGKTMELKNNGKTTIFSGGVKMLRDNNVMVSDTMTYHKETGDVDIIGNVKLRLRGESGETILAKGGRAYYNEQRRSGRLWERPEIIRTGPDTVGQVNIYAREITYDENTEYAEAHGEVRILQNETSAFADNALLRYREDTLILSGGKPRLARKDAESIGEYFGNTITMGYKEKKIILEGNVHGWLRLAKKKK